MIQNVNKELGLAMVGKSLPAPNLNYQLGLSKGQSDMLSFDGTYVVPSDAVRTGNSTFNRYINDRKDKVLSLSKKLQNDRNSGVYWDRRVLDLDVNEESIRELSKSAEEKSKEFLNRAKKLRQEAIDEENDWNTSAAKARERVDAQINTSQRNKKLDDAAYSKIGGIRDSLIRHASYKVLRDAYISELEVRLDKQKQVRDALASEDVKKLQNALGLATTEKQKNALQAKIDFVKESEKRQSKIDTLTDQLAGATGEQAEAIKNEIDALRNEENIARGNLPEEAKPNYLLIGGVGLAALLGVVLILRRR